jgi:vacuolar-type H+-ATPase subunit H
MTLKEVIEDILQTEKEGRNRVEDARQKAKEIVLAAETEAQKLRQITHEKAVQQGKDLISQTEAEAHKEKEAAITEADDAMKSFWDDKRDVIEQSIEKLFQMIIAQDS